MKSRWLPLIGGAVMVMAVFATVSVSAAEILSQKATSGRFRATGFYPYYMVFLKGLDPATVETEWVDKPYMAVLDVHDGPEAGKSVVLELQVSTEASPNPQWCKTEGGKEQKGQGITCLAGDPATEQLRYRVKAHWADMLPEEFAGRDVVEFPDLPGRRENETLERFDLHILKD